MTLAETQKSEKSRKLRIAFSATCLIACVLLIVMWVRSYRTADEIFAIFSKHRFSFHSEFGGLSAVSHAPANVPNGAIWTQREPTAIISPSRFQFASQLVPSPFRFAMPEVQTTASVPHWFLVVSATILATLPWIRQLRWRFSLRTLLIATTLVAVVLGAIVYVARQ
jgi:hypothetical protein